MVTKILLTDFPGRRQKVDLSGQDGIFQLYEETRTLP